VVLGVEESDAVLVEVGLPGGECFSYGFEEGFESGLGFGWEFAGVGLAGVDDLDRGPPPVVWQNPAPEGHPLLTTKLALGGCLSTLVPVDVERAFGGMLCTGAAVAAAALDGEPPPLTPEEAPAATTMLPQRRAEFALGRECARRALAALNWTPVGLPMRPDGSPQWPPGVVGSITHWDGWCVAAVASAETCRMIGIDGEPRRPLPEEVRTLVLTAPEEAWLEGTDPDLCFDTALFTMKEAVYKAWAPVTGLWLDFLDVDITVDPEAGTFRSEPLPDLHGRFTIEEDAVLAAVLFLSVDVGGSSDGERDPRTL
jgi:4'-phosphopantetheinyl transferase EntD